MLGLGTLTRVARELREDLTAAQERDPAAREVGRLEILLTYGGVQALLSHRVAHALHQTGVPFAPRLLANATRVLTGVEIHDVPANATVVGNPGHPVRVDGKRPSGPDADWAHLPDPVADAIKALASRMNEVEELVAELTGKKPEERADVHPFRQRRG